MWEKIDDYYNYLWEEECYLEMQALLNEMREEQISREDADYNPYW